MLFEFWTAYPDDMKVVQIILNAGMEKKRLADLPLDVKQEILAVTVRQPKCAGALLPAVVAVLRVHFSTFV